jgi:hypothetical protein
MRKDYVFIYLCPLSFHVPAFYSFQCKRLSAPKIYFLLCFDDITNVIIFLIFSNINTCVDLYYLYIEILQIF